MLRKLHKQIGIVTGPLMVLWFLSGLVMMYVGHPGPIEPHEIGCPPCGRWQQMPLYSILSKHG
jgi:hypothetical protein